MSTNNRKGPQELEDEAQRVLLGEPIGVPESGLTRYAAAMYFYQRGSIGADTLEVYRMCSPFDGEDPRVVLRQYGFATGSGTAGVFPAAQS